MSWFSKRPLELPCPQCGESFPASEVLFICSNRKCHMPMPNQPKSVGNYTFFKAEEFRPVVQCPYCSLEAYLLCCPECFAPLPVGIADRSTIAVVGARRSGKTCYITCLLHQIQQVLSEETSLGASLLWNDDAGRTYYEKQRKTIFENLGMPDMTVMKEKDVPKAIYLQMQFRLRSTWSRVERPLGQVPLVFPDPGGDLFRSLRELYFQTYLRNAKALILLLDSTPGGVGADEQIKCLGNLIGVVRGGNAGRIDKILAVAVTKCDEPDVFDPDDFPDKYPRQGVRYNLKQARRLGKRVENYINNQFKQPVLVTTARNNFKRVEFFAISAFGQTPSHDGRLTAPVCPRRVEDPLLWILNTWGHNI